MARKPVHLRPGVHVDAREAAWAAMRKLKQFTMEDLQKATKDNYSTLATYVQALAKGGYVEMVGHDTRGVRTAGIRQRKNINHAGIFRLIKDVGYHAPRVKRDGTPVTQGKGRENMWRVIKVLSEFDWHDLAEAASGKDCAVAPNEAKDYVNTLAKAGYLRTLQKAKPGTAARYCLIQSRWSGPKSPMIQRVKQVYDPNLGKVVWPLECAQ
ncbi:MAG: hypothetical protein R3E64_04205 [Halioglobus sp.]